MHDPAERIVRLKPSEMIHMLQLAKYSLPALHGWHAMYDSSVVAPASGYNSGGGKEYSSSTYGGNKY